MVECDYCDATFESEDAYLAHLREAHEGELGTIDQRRVADLNDEEGGLPTGPLIIAGVVLAGLALVAFLVAGSGGDGSGDDGGGLPTHGDEAVISQVQTEPAQSNNHVEPGTDINYSTVPPTGGTHYGTTVNAGFYEETQPLGALVHSLEHGAIVVYYDPAQLTDDAEEHLRTYADRHTGTWQSFVAVPNPNEDPDAAYILTAWEKRLTLEEYDEDAVRAFTAEYLGRGPENPIRPTEN